MLESPFQKKAIKYVNERCEAVKVISCNKPGWPDITGCYKGLFFAIELKRTDGKGKKSPLQKYRRKKIKAAGGRAIFADNMKAIKKLFKEMDEVT